MRFAHPSSKVDDDDAPPALPSLGELPPLGPDETEAPIADRASGYAIEDEDEDSTIHEQDAVEGPAVSELIDALDDAGSALDDADPLDERIDEAIDEAPDHGAIGDDDDGLGNDASDLDESLLSDELGDDGADGVISDRVDLDDPDSPLDGSDHEDDAEEPILLPPLPDLEPVRG
jgi:hypothetical protein